MKILIELAMDTAAISSILFCIYIMIKYCE